MVSYVSLGILLHLLLLSTYSGASTDIPWLMVLVLLFPSCIVSVLGSVEGLGSRPHSGPRDLEGQDTPTLERTTMEAPVGSATQEVDTSTSFDGNIYLLSWSSGCFAVSGLFALRVCFQVKKGFPETSKPWREDIPLHGLRREKGSPGPRQAHRDEQALRQVSLSRRENPLNDDVSEVVVSSVGRWWQTSELDIRKV